MEVVGVDQAVGLPDRFLASVPPVPGVPLAHAMVDTGDLRHGARAPLRRPGAAVGHGAHLDALLQQLDDEQPRVETAAEEHRRQAGPMVLSDGALPESSELVLRLRRIAELLPKVAERPAAVGWSSDRGTRARCSPAERHGCRATRSDRRACGRTRSAGAARSRRSRARRPGWQAAPLTSEAYANQSGVAA